MSPKPLIAKYAVGCQFGNDVGIDSLFFVTFTTTNEDEALKLASCVCGKEYASRSLIVINDDGDMFL